MLAITIGLLAFLARRRYRDNRPLVRVTTAAFGLVLFQAALGGLTVEKGLKEELVAAHLGVAMLQIGLLILVAYIARAPADAGGSTRQLTSTPQSVCESCPIAATGAVLGDDRCRRLHVGERAEGDVGAEPGRPHRLRYRVPELRGRVPAVRPQPRSSTSISPIARSCTLPRCSCWRCSSRRALRRRRRRSIRCS